MSGACGLRASGLHSHRTSPTQRRLDAAKDIIAGKNYSECVGRCTHVQMCLCS